MSRDPLPEPLETTAPSRAHDAREWSSQTPAASRVSEDGRRWHRWHVGTFIDRARGDSLLRNSLFIMATTLVTSALGFAFWLVAARLFSAPAVGLTAAITSAGTIVVLVSSLGVGGTLIQSLPGQPRRNGVVDDVLGRDGDGGIRRCRAQLGSPSWCSRSSPPN